MGEFDERDRFKSVNGLAYTAGEFRAQMTNAAAVLWTKVVNASNDIYKRIQLLEADYIELKSTLDDKIDYELENMEQKRREAEREIAEVESEIDDYDAQRKQIERAYNRVGGERKVRGSLDRLSGWWFLFVMSVAGFAELFIYKNVFLSQEIGLRADLAAEEKYMVQIMALGMALGFTVMLIWIAHKLGEMMRHYDSIIDAERRVYLTKFFMLMLVVILAIAATVDIRGKMHEILAKDQRIETLQRQTEISNDHKMFNGTGKLADEDGDAGGLGDEESDEGLSDGSGLDDDDGHGGFGEEDEAEEAVSDNNDDKHLFAPSVSDKIESLRDAIVQEKDATAWLFTIINIFMVVGGMFLSYATHTSSRVYETIEKRLKVLHRQKAHLDKKLRRIEHDIVRFKARQINRLYKELLLRSALYDKEVRTYNAYMEIFLMKMRLIEEHLQAIYEAHDAPVPAECFICEKEGGRIVVVGTIVVDRREELHHVRHVDEYMIYRKENRKGGEDA